MPRFIIEARDIAYNRIGLVENYVSFEGIIRHNAVGSWSLTVPGGTPEVGYLQPGNGVIVRIDGQDDVAFSGPITKIARQWSDSDQGPGSVTVSGVTDEQLLFERVTYPIPANDLDHQTDDRHITLSNVGTLMEILVRENCGPDARPERIYPELDVADGVLIGGPASVSTRFDVLGEKIQELANSQGLAFRVRQGNNGERLLFDMFTPEDKSDLIFGRQYGNLQAYDYDLEAPTATRVIFAAQGEGKDRYFQDAVYDPWLVETWDDRDPRITYSASVEKTPNTEAYRGTYSELDVLGRTMTFNLTGTGFRLYGRHQSTFAHTNNITIDGVGPSFFNTTGPENTPRVMLYEHDGLTYGAHNISIDATYGFWLDYIEIIDDRILADWRRNSERFYDRRDIPVAWNAAHTSLVDPGELDGGGIPLPADPAVYGPLLDQATLEAWDENGPKGSLSMTPIDTEAVKYGRDYQVGDIVTVDIDGTLFTEILREVRLSDGSDGPRITPTIGDTQASSTPTLYRTVRRLWSKVRKLEAQ